MQRYLVTIPLPEGHEGKRKRILSAVVGQLELENNAEIVSQEIGFRGLRGKGKAESLWQVKLEVPWPDDVDHAAELARSAEEAGQAALRGLRISNCAVRVFVLEGEQVASESEEGV